MRQMLDLGNPPAANDANPNPAHDLHPLNLESIRRAYRLVLKTPAGKAARQLLLPQALRARAFDILARRAGLTRGAARSASVLDALPYLK